MIIMGVDPGVTTGYCIVSREKPGQMVVKNYGHLSHDWMLSENYDNIMERHKPEIIVMESVVPTGRLNREKMLQITAADRLLMVALQRGVVVIRVTPQEIKRIKDVTSEVSGIHARDAYRVVVAYNIFVEKDFARPKGIHYDTNIIAGKD